MGFDFREGISNIGINPVKINALLERNFIMGIQSSGQLSHELISTGNSKRLFVQSKDHSFFDVLDFNCTLGVQFLDRAVTTQQVIAFGDAVR